MSLTARWRLVPGLLLALALSAGTVGAEPWPRFRGPNGTGAVADKDVPLQFSEKENVLWKVAIPGVGLSSPVVWGKNVFIHSSKTDGTERMLLCLDADTGATRWTAKIPARKAHAHQLNTLASSTPTTDGEAVYVAFWDGKDILLAAYDLGGRPLWRRDLGPWVSEHGAGASPIVFKDSVILANDMDKEVKGRKGKPGKRVPDASTLVAFNKKTGAPSWRSPREPHRACYSAPFVLARAGGSPELIVTSTTAVTGYDPATGTKLWNWPWVHVAKAPLRTIAGSVFVDDLLVSFSGDGGGGRHTVALALKGTGPRTEPKKVWENTRANVLPYVPCPLVRGDHIYFVNDGGYAGCYDARTGKSVWYERQPGARFTASPVMVNGKVIAPSDQGDVYVFDAEPTYKAPTRNTLAQSVRATPAIADGRLYLRGQTYLYCIGRPRGASR